MIEKIQAVIFDIDGTLVNSMGLWHEIDIEYFGLLGIPMPDNIKSAIEGMSFSETAVYFKETFQLEKSIEEIKNDWIAMATNKYRHGITAKAGAVEYIRFLKAHGIKIGVATSNDRKIAIASLEPHGILEQVDSLRTACEFATGKSAPDIYLKVAEDLGTEPKHCLVFEDIPLGMRSAKAAGMQVIAVRDEISVTCYQKDTAFVPDGAIDDYTDLLEGRVEVSYEFSSGK